jgi:hypothetical protein
VKTPRILRNLRRILRNLRIEDVSSVDAGAGRGVRVVLTKRDKQEAEMVDGTCPKCGHMAELANFAGGKRKVGKVDTPDSEVIHKAVNAVHGDIAKRLMSENPGMSLDRAMREATSTAEYSRLHADERRARFGY